MATDRSFVAVLLAVLLGGISAQATPIRVGSKSDTEGSILAELIAQLLERTGEAPVERRGNLGGTMIAMAALDAQSVDVMPEYSGTLAHFVLHQPNLSDFATIARETTARGYVVSPPLGFDNTYALGMREERARALGIRRISDVARFPALRAGFSPEFYSGEFGWPGVRRAYGFDLINVRSLAHGIAYDALTSGAVDVIDLYTTDAQISALRLVTLDDERGVLSHYYGLVIARRGFERDHPRSWAAIQSLGGRLTQARMIELNRQSELAHRPFRDIARDALPMLGFGAPREGGATNARQPAAATTAQRFADVRRRLWPLTLEHLWLVFTSLFASVLLGLPLGVAASRSPLLGHLVLSAAGVVQTIPSVALLCFLIPVMGIGTMPAIVALVLYGLFPIVRGAVTGLASVDKHLLDVAHVLGMTPRQRLLQVELPLASVAILNGIKVTAVTNVGTATLAALIGGGGYGTLIVTGLGINDQAMVLAGAVPSALLAFVFHAGFEVLDRVFVPQGLRTRAVVR